MSTLSTHVLDVVAGVPARGVPVALSSRADDGSWVDVHATSTDNDGRVADLAPGGVAAGVHRLVFDIAAWSAAAARPCFYPEVAVVFTVEEERHNHVPLLLSPYAYSTYRGS
jgi:5-hydroxyisourate hydrolase